ncbi:MAG TPA: DNA recombination protein RmuC [Xanthobacteraceae bacterium]|jgi:DNA recombination protein RmuC
MSEVLVTLSGIQITTAHALLALGAVVLVLLIVLLIAQARAGRTRADETADLEERVAEFVRIQTENSGRMQTLAEVLGGRQADLARVVSERLDTVSHRLGENVATAARATFESLSQLQERIAVVDAAQTRIAELSSHMITLKDVLANKQARGAFGQGRMEAIVADGLPKDAYTFQHTLTNGKRPDCVVYLPGDDGRPLVIDAKFPLESVTALREAKNEDDRRAAVQRLRQDIAKHVSDISERYLLPGETQDVALMFVPSESVFAELHEQFDDLVQKAFRARVLLVSPSLLMLAIQVLQAIVKDARMREHADVIRTEVTKLIGDVGRLRDRALNLQKHFAQASDDVGQVLISAEKVVKRGNRIEAIEFEEEVDTGPRAEAPTLPLGRRAAE